MKTMVVLALMACSTAAAEVSHKPASVAVSGGCSVGYLNHPEMKVVAQKLARVCSDTYPKVYKALEGSNHVAMIAFSIYAKDAAADTRGGVVRLSVDWFKAHPDDTGCLVHELAHVAQGYPDAKKRPWWLVEGLADLMRSRFGSGAGNWNLGCSSGEDLRSGYRCTGAFLQFIAREKGEKVIQAVNRGMRRGDFTEVDFEKSAGEKLPVLWNRCLSSDCAGGKVIAPSGLGHPG